LNGEMAEKLAALAEVTDRLPERVDVHTGKNFAA